MEMSNTTEILLKNDVKSHNPSIQHRKRNRNGPLWISQCLGIMSRETLTSGQEIHRINPYLHFNNGNLAAATLPAGPSTKTDPVT